MPRDFYEPQTYTAEEVSQVAFKAVSDAYDNIIEDMVNGDQGNHRSRFKTAVKFIRERKVRFELEAQRGGIIIPETDVLRNSGTPHTTSGEAFNWDAPSMKFLRTFLPALGFMAVTAWWVSVLAS